MKEFDSIHFIFNQNLMKNILDETFSLKIKIQIIKKPTNLPPPPPCEK